MTITHVDSRQQALCDAFNTRVPVGTEVHLRNDRGEIEHTRTRSEAWVLGGRTAVVAVEGRAGGYLLDRITPVQ